MQQHFFRKLQARVAVFALGCTLLAMADYPPGNLLSLAEQRYGSTGAEVVSRWLNILEQSSSLSEHEKLLRVNDFFNRQITFKDDLSIWNTNDYWATPLETMGRGQGDCEDFSIAKYISLIKLGVPMEKLRLTYVKADMGMQRSQAHMILAYYTAPDEEPLILDNLSTEIRAASERSDLKPVFSFNSAGLWVGKAAKPKVLHPETRLSRWRDVLNRMQLER